MGEKKYEVVNLWAVNNFITKKFKINFLFFDVLKLINSSNEKITFFTFHIQIFPCAVH